MLYPLLPHELTRRDFLKLCGFGLSGLVLPPGLASVQQVQFQGRVLEPSVHVFDSPSFSGQLVKLYWRDLVVPIHYATVGDQEPAYNRVWYRTPDGYVHSGLVQPVEIRPNEPSMQVPEGGRLAEVTVPFTDTWWKPNSSSLHAYRIYYGTTHWVRGTSLDEKGNLLYRLFDDKWKIDFYAKATHLRLVPYEELAPISPDIPSEEKRLEVRLAEQAVIAYEAGRAVYMARAATGGNFSTGDYTTPTGHYVTNHKRPTRHMAAGDRAAPNSYDLPGVPWVCYFTPEGISFHGTFWHNDFGKPRSHGCINLTVSAARWVYRWTLPAVPPQEIFTFESFGTSTDII